MGPAAVIFAGTTILSIIMEIYQRMQSDPNVDVQGAIDTLQRGQLSEFEIQEANKVGRAKDRQKRDTGLAQNVITDVSMLRSGLMDDQIMPGMNPQPGALSESVAGQLGIDPRQLRERLSPRRMGDLSDMTQDLVRGAR